MPVRLFSDTNFLVRQEAQEQLELSPEQLMLLENHCLLNLFNVLESQLSELNRKIPDSEIKQYSHFCLEVLMDLPRFGARSFLPKLEMNCSRLRTYLTHLQEVHTGHKELFAGLTETVAVGHLCIQELKGHRHTWQALPLSRFRESLFAFLKATERVSQNRFKIEFAPDPPSGRGYWVDLKLNFNESSIHAPLILNDLIRDLVANARKYSEPGTAITVELSPNFPKGLLLKVTDEGIGIPEDELHKVIQFGYRAANVLDRRTMGGGIGLTKAYHLCKRYNGEFSIESEIGKGTTIQMSLFPPP